MNAVWVRTEKGKVIDTAPLWAFIDEYGHTVIQVPSKKYPKWFLREVFG